MRSKSNLEKSGAEFIVGSALIQIFSKVQHKHVTEDKTILFSESAAGQARVRDLGELDSGREIRAREAKASLSRAFSKVEPQPSKAWNHSQPANQPDRRTHPSPSTGAVRCLRHCLSTTTAVPSRYRQSKHHRLIAASNGSS